MHGAADISGGGANIFSGMPDILYVQHQLFENFWAFQREKYTFLKKWLKIGLVAKNCMGGGYEICQAVSFALFLAFLAP